MDLRGAMLKSVFRVLGVKFGGAVWRIWMECLI